MWPLLPLLLQCDVFPRLFFTILPQAWSLFYHCCFFGQSNYRAFKSILFNRRKKEEKKKGKFCFARHRITNVEVFLPQKVSCSGLCLWFMGTFQTRTSTHMHMYACVCIHRACSWTSHPGTIKFSPKLPWGHYSRSWQSQFLSVPTV